MPWSGYSGLTDLAAPDGLAFTRTSGGVLVSNRTSAAWSARGGWWAQQPCFGWTEAGEKSAVLGVAPGASVDVPVADPGVQGALASRIGVELWDRPCGKECEGPPDGFAWIPAGSPQPAPPSPAAEDPTWPPQPPRDLRYTPIERLTLSGDGRRLTLAFAGAREYSPGDPCSADYAATADVVRGVLEVGVEESRRPAASEGAGCDAMGHARSLRVDLHEPFTGSAWRDLSGYLHFLAAPAGLVELAGLPSGWGLRDQRDVEESPTGRWERTYSPDRTPSDQTRTLVLYQSFGGPVNVTGGTDERQVAVGGRPATLYRWPPTGELVLVWRLGNDGLALVAYEQRFSVEQLIALAESATPARDSNGSPRP
jgi:hypothetical protein